MCPRLTKTSTMLRSPLTMWRPSWGEVYLEPNLDWQATTTGFGRRPACRDRSRCATSRSVKPSRFWTPTAPPATSSRWTRIHFLIQIIQKNQQILTSFLVYFPWPFLRQTLRTFVLIIYCIFFCTTCFGRQQILDLYILIIMFQELKTQVNQLSAAFQQISEN